MATETVSAINGDSRKASEIAPEILGVDPQLRRRYRHRSAALGLPRRAPDALGMGVSSCAP